MIKKNKETKVTKLTWGLFHYKWKYPFYALKHTLQDIRVYFMRIGFLLKHGYGEPALWETYAWFIDWAREVLTWNRNKRSGTPVLDASNLSDSFDTEKNEADWDAVLDKMLSLLDDMEEKDIEDWSGEKEKEMYERMQAAKDEFFILWSKYFYYLWD